MTSMAREEKIWNDEELTLALLKEQGQRSLLSQSDGAPINSLELHPEYQLDPLQTRSLAPSGASCKILGFDLKILNEMRNMINQRLQYAGGKIGLRVSVFDTLAAILWRAIIRARWPPPAAVVKGQKSALIFPVNIRRVIQPTLSADYYGNACLFNYTSQPTNRLLQPLNIGTLSHSALLIRESIHEMVKDDLKLRSAVKVINSLADVTDVNHPNIDFANDVFLTSWADLPTGEDASLGLGSGPPDALRKPSRQHSAYGCMVLPKNLKKGVWEVQVQLAEDVMERLLKDQGVVKLLKCVT